MSITNFVCPSQTLSKEFVHRVLIVYIFKSFAKNGPHEMTEEGFVGNLNKYENLIFSVNSRGVIFHHETNETDFDDLPLIDGEWGLFGKWFIHGSQTEIQHPCKILIPSKQIKRVLGYN